jgi:hypothetical protein
VHVASEIGAYEAEEIGTAHLKLKIVSLIVSKKHDVGLSFENANAYLM